jgi:16S rRNA processing protein RimM
LKKNLVLVGKFGKPVGLKGEIKIIMYLEDINVFKKLEPYLDEYGRNAWNFEYLKFIGNKVVGKFSECDSRNCIEKICGKNIYAKKNHFPKINNKNEYYNHELIDCNVVDIRNEHIGKIKNIENYGAGNLMNIIKKNGDGFYIPINSDNVHKIKFKENLIIY